MEPLKPSDLNFDGETITVVVCSIIEVAKQDCKSRVFHDEATAAAYIEDEFGDAAAQECERALGQSTEFAYISGHRCAYVRLAPIETEGDFR